MQYCEICGKEFKNANGLRGHNALVHGVASASAPPNSTQEHELAQLGPAIERIKGQIIPLIERIGPAIEGIEDRLTERLTPLLERFCENVLPAHKPGLCQYPTCQSCEASIVAIAGDAEKQVHQRLERAVEALGMTEAGDRLAQAYNNIVEGKEPLDGITDPNAVYVNIEGLGLLRVVDDPPPTQQYEFYHNKSGNLCWGIPQ